MLASGCFHCGLPLPFAGPVRQPIAGEAREFCCAACAQVCAIIHESGLNSFYRHAPSDRQWTPPEAAPEDADIFDRIELQADFVRRHDNGDHVATLLIEGIHCPACVWLIEHAVQSLPGVVQAEVNFTKQCLMLRWRPNQLRLSEAIRAIGKFGYRALPFEQSRAQEMRKKKRQDLMFRMAFAGFVVANVMTAAVCLYAGDFFGISDKYRALFSWYSLVLTLASILYSGRSFFVSAGKALRARVLNMDVPISLGIAVSFVWSLWATVHPAPGLEGHIYFDSISMFIFLILIGRFLESSARESASSASEHLLTLLPRSARRIDAQGREQLVPLRSVMSGDMLCIKPGDKVPVDGLVLEGASAVNESMLSGESRPVSKAAGDKVIGGTLNSYGLLTIRATDVGHGSVLSRIVELVEQAQNTRVRAQRLADRIVPWFVAIVLTLACAAFAFWSIRADLPFAIMAAVTVLIITCPCALGLATPMAIAVGAGLGSRLGVLVKHGMALEKLSDIDHVVFDKTGTLTQGNIQVKHSQAFQDGIWENVARLASASEHPLASAIHAHLDQPGPAIRLADFSNTPGRGVSAITGQKRMYLGSLAWLAEHGISPPESAAYAMQCEEAAGHTIVCVFSAGALLGWLALGDELRPESSEVLNGLRQMGMEISLLSGDRRAVAEAVAARLGGDLQVIAEVMPGDKAERIRALQAEGKRVAMVGDGVNDAPALTQADVGIAVGQASDISAHAADIVLLGGLDKALTAVALSAATMRTIRQNLALSLAYNALAAPLAMAGMVHPLLAAIAMPASSLLVIGNAMRIRWKMRQF